MEIIHKIRFLAVGIILTLFASELHAETEWSPEQKEACNALLSQYASKVEPSFKNDKTSEYWHKLILNDGAIHFSRITFSKYTEEIQTNPQWSVLYRFVDRPLEKSDVWRIEVVEPHPMSSDNVILVIFISTSSRQIITAWEIPGG